MEQENMLQPEEEIQASETPVEQPVSETESTPKAVVEEKSTPEIPDIDFSTLTTEEIVHQMQKLVSEYPVNLIKDVIESLPELFETQYKEEYEKALAAFTADGDSPEGFEYKNDTRERFNNIYKLYKEKKSSASRKTEAEREENLKIKLGIIEELKALIQKEESLDKTFQEFRDLQERWRNTGMVPQAKLNGLLETYHLHVENFYNYIKINKELRDLDLKRNLDEKNQLCEEAEKLVESNDIAESFKHLQLLHARWKEIGPIPKDQKEPVWERFKAATGQINDKYHNFFESLKKEQEDNLKVKEEICIKASAIADGEYKSISEWNTATKNIIDLQEEWKHSGTIPQKERNRIYKKFRAACDLFFDRKREFFKKMLEEQEKNLELKVQLCEKVEAIKDSTDWKVTTDKIISYQKEWKEIGPAPKKHSNKVWMRFRAACDTFFNNKSAHFKDIDSEQGQNLEKKKALIEEVKQFTLSGSNETDIAKLKEFQSRWAKIGFVPIKEKDAVQEEFRGLINGWFDKLNLDEFDKNLERYRAKINSFDSGENKEYKIINEREKLVSKIRQLETDVNTWENNIGFIAKSNKSQGLIQELTSQIEKTKQRLALLKEKLKAIDNMI
ncbi:MAG: DUF349 domain-containing protein [Odoribacter splanchnicus]|nr:DUF349 domain-containing protein [Odoribacter splanchnicus]MBD9180380.1 DUF349 domain-containing protein [Odoribacter splanchnicus]